jgi:uncharacterized repeat protein (TIGR01451 family)/MYXO-CTERM domain-containing protein
MIRGNRETHRLAGMAAAVALGLGAATATGFGGSAHAAGGSVVQAEGDAYAVGAEASLIGQGPIHAGPVSPALAYVPPTGTQSSTASLVNCDNGVGPNCLDPLVDAVNVLQSNGDASLTGVTAHCPGAPAGFGGNTVVGGSACVTIASAAALNSGSANDPTDQLFASGVSAQSQAQGCGDSTLTGKVNIATLVVGGTTIVGDGGIVDATPPPNTVVPLGIITVILNEQHYDNQGHGLIVNAVHVFTSADLGQLANVDLIIGHAHSEDVCDTGTVATPAANPGASGQALPTGVKADSTKHANPGEVVTYTLTITTNGCEVVSVVDDLPSGFQYVSGSAHGDLGTTPTVTQSTSNPAIQQLEWYNPTGWSAATLTETLQAKVPDGAAPGDYVNDVAGESSPAAGNGGIVCGSFEFSDTLGLNGLISANNGNNPGIIVPRPVVASPPPSTTATPAAASVQGAAAQAIPNTAGAPSAAWVTAFALGGLGVLALLRRRNRRRMG